MTHVIAADNIRAGMLMATAMACFTINDALIKSIDGAIPVAQILAWRGLFTCALLGLLLALALRRRHIQLRDFAPALGNRFVLLRGACELVGSALFLLALTRLPFPTIGAILQAMPLVVTAGAALLLGEHVGARRWSAIGIGLIGVLIILRPGTDSFDPAVFFMVACVLVAAGRDLATRKVPGRVPTLAVSMTTALIMTVAGALAAVVFAGSGGAALSLPATRSLLVMALAALFIVGAMQAIVLAMRMGEVSAVVPYRYTGLLWAIAVAWVFFGERPDAWTVVGGSIVVATGLYTFARERALGRAASVKDTREGVAAGR